jgi:hypothetical protein
LVKPFDLVFTVFDADLAKLSADRLEQLIVGLLQKAGALQSSVPTGAHAIVKKVSKED